MKNRLHLGFYSHENIDEIPVVTPFKSGLKEPIERTNEIWSQESLVGLLFMFADQCLNVN